MICWTRSFVDHNPDVIHRHTNINGSILPVEIIIYNIGKSIFNDIYAKMNSASVIGGTVFVVFG